MEKCKEEFAIHIYLIAQQKEWPAEKIVPLENNKALGALQKRAR